MLDERWCRPLAPAELEHAVQGRRVERLGRRGKYLVWELTDDVFLLMHLRMTGTLLLDPDPPSRHPRVRLDLGDHVLRVRRPPPLRHRRARARAGGARRVLRRAARRRAVRARVHGRAPVRARADLARADKGIPARSEADRRRREHLRRRGAVPRRASTRCGPRTASRAPRPPRCATRSWRRCWPAWRPRARRSTTSATPTASAGASRTSSSCTSASTSRARTAATRCASSAPRDAGPTCASAASRGPARRRRAA